VCKYAKPAPKYHTSALQSSSGSKLVLSLNV
jgi:hypothetical protein